MGKNKISRFRILGLVFLGGITTGMTHRIKIYEEGDVLYSHNVQDLTTWTHQGFPFAFHHEALGYGNFAIHDWSLFLINTFIWAIVWFLLFRIVCLIRKRI